MYLDVKKYLRARELNTPKKYALLYGFGILPVIPLGNIPVEKTVSGTIIHVTDAVEEPATKLAVTMTPSQEATPFIDATTKEPYLSKTASTTGNKRYLDKIVGGTVCWNQLEPLDASKYTKTNITLSLSNGEYTFTPTTSTSVPKYASMELTVGHVYFVSGKIGSSSDTTRSRAGIINNTGTNIISINGQGEYRSGTFIHKVATNEIFALRVNNATTSSESGYAKDLQVTDLTQLFSNAPAIADYIYSLEQATTGAGVQWLKSHGFIDDNYRAYNLGELISSKPTAFTVGGDTYALGGVDLRGLFKLDSNNNLYCDGDELTPDGNISIKGKQIVFGNNRYTWAKGSPNNDGDGIIYYTSNTNDFNERRTPYNLLFSNTFVMSTISNIQTWEELKVNTGIISGGSLRKALVVCVPNTVTTVSDFISAYGDINMLFLASTPTTSSSTPYTNPVNISNGDTEAFTDTRAVPIPVGNESHYAGEYEIEGYESVTVYQAQTQDEPNPTEYEVEFTEHGTVYGGTVDIVTGELNITWKSIDLGTIETWTEWRVRGVRQTWYAPIADAKGNWATYGNTQYCSKYPNAQIDDWTLFDKQCKFGNASININIKDSAYNSNSITAADFKASVQGVQLVYELATPITAQLTPQEVQMLLGENYFWAENGENIELTYIGNNRNAEGTRSMKKSRKSKQKPKKLLTF